MKPDKSKKYLYLVHTLPCCVSGEYGVSAHHIKEGWYCMGKKSPDYHAIPLIPWLHQNSNEAFHVMGAKRWREKYGSEIDLARKTQKLIMDKFCFVIPEEYVLLKVVIIPRHCDCKSNKFNHHGLFG